MKINQKTRLSFFSELYENAKNHIAPIHEKMDEYMAQYMGSDRIDGSSVPAAIVRNITYELLEAEISSEIPAPRVSPELYSEKNDRNSRAVERLCLSLRDRLPFEEMNDRDERYTYVYGGSVFFVEWDDTAESGLARGGVRISCLSPKSLIPEPYVTDIDDMEYCFLRFDTTRDELCRRYGVTEEVAALASPEADAGGMDEDDLVTVVVCFYKNERGEVSEYVFSGEAELLSLDDYYSRRGDVCLRCGDTRDGCRCEHPRMKKRSIKTEHPKKDITLTDGRIIPKMSPLVDNFGEIVRKNGVQRAPHRSTHKLLRNPRRQRINGHQRTQLRGTAARLHHGRDHGKLHALSFHLAKKAENHAAMRAVFDIRLVKKRDRTIAEFIYRHEFRQRHTASDHGVFRFRANRHDERANITILRRLRRFHVAARLVCARIKMCKIRCSEKPQLMKGFRPFLANAKKTLDRRISPYGKRIFSHKDTSFQLFYVI